MMILHQIPGYFSSKFSNIRTEFSGVSARDTQKFDEKNFQAFQPEIPKSLMKKIE